MDLGNTLFASGIAQKRYWKINCGNSPVLLMDRPKPVSYILKRTIIRCIAPKHSTYPRTQGARIPISDYNC